MRTRSLLLRSFSFLDFVCLLFLGMQLWLFFDSGLWPKSGLEQLSIWLRTATFALIGVSWVGLFLGKRWGILAYYVQFPFRLVFFIYSIGFITLLPEAFGSYETFWYDWLLGLCVVFEFLRLYLTVQHHRSRGPQ